jgi:hypothetical protein
MATLKKIFPYSPIYTKEITNEERLAEFQKVLSEPITQNVSFGTFDPNFSGAPDIAIGNVDTGAGGWPASPWVPNPVSPGPGSTNPGALPEAPEGFGTTTNQGSADQGSRLSPKKSSALIAQQKIGEYVLQPLSRAYLVGG